MGLMCLTFVEHGLNGTGEGGEAPMSRRDEGAFVFELRRRLFEMLRNWDVIAAS